jgi:tRNA (cytidine/uridine-2'-O-)-methyltransferase
MRLVLFEPDIPQNCGALLRLGACLGVAVDIIEPCGFHLDEKRMRRAGMDYLDRANVKRHTSWDAYLRWRQGRLILLTTRADAPYTTFAFRPDDNLMVGRIRLAIPMCDGMRSINVAQAAAMAVGEALRQTDGFPGN